MDDPRTTADARLDQALAGADIRDPRPGCRDRLRALRAVDADAFSQALAYFETTLVPAIAGGAEPLSEWVDYGRFLAERGGGGSGRVLALDASGRARPYEPPPAGELVLFVPGDTRRPVTPLLEPQTLSAPQQATLDLLVRGRREL
jgi:hypothetical protein